MNGSDHKEVRFPIPLIGIERETQRLEHAFERGVRAAVVHGPPGSGKTAFAQKYQSSGRLSPGGYINLAAFSPTTAIDALNIVARPKVYSTRPILTVVDDIHYLTASDIKDLESWLSQYSNHYVILAARHTDAISTPHVVDIALGTLSLSDYDSLIRARLGISPNDTTRQLHRRLDGNPKLLMEAINAIAHGKLSWDEVLRYVDSFEYSGIVGPDGRPLAPESSASKAITLDVRRINSQLLSRMKARPDAMRQLSPRQFEEMIADLLHELGYTVDLTQQTRDGGFDIYAAKKDPLGSFLYLVECKKYTPPNKVGVDVVRSLYGVVETENATAGIVASSSFFTADAQDFQRRHMHELHLKDYVSIQEWLGQVSH